MVAEAITNELILKQDVIILKSWYSDENENYIYQCSIPILVIKYQNIYLQIAI